ncbi:MAG: amidase, partial [Proteobacteria bacterium]|nr:amidase [Pseudomonadota bacterium]
VPAGPDLGERWAGMSVSHALTLSVRDSAALLDAAAGPEVGDPYSAPAPARPYLDEVGADPGRLRIAVSAAPPNGVPVHADCRAALDRAAKLCADLGHDIEEAGPAFDGAAIDAARLTVIRAHLAADLDERAGELGRDLRADDVEPMTWAIAHRGEPVSGADYVAAVQAMHRIGRQVAGFFLDCDVLMTPALATPPVAIGALDPTGDDLDAYLDAMARFAAFSPLANVTGAPAMSAPLHWNAEGLPVGVQFVGRFGDEATLFRLAAQIEEAAPWAGRRPEAT